MFSKESFSVAEKAAYEINQVTVLVILASILEHMEEPMPINLVEGLL